MATRTSKEIRAEIETEFRAVEEVRKTVLETDRESYKAGEWSPEESGRHDEGLEKIDTLEAELAEIVASERDSRFEATRSRLAQPARDRRGLERDNGLGASLNSTEFRQWMLTGESNGKLGEISFELSNETRSALTRSNARNPMVDETRALSVGTNTAGGHGVADEPMAPIEVALRSYGNVASVAQVVTTATGAPFPWPTMNDTSNAGQQIGENAARRTNQDPTFGQVELNAYMITSDIVLVSREVLEDFNSDLGSILGAELGERLSDNTNGVWTTGDGSSKPNGVANAAEDSSQNVTATGITRNELIDVEAALNIRYRRNASWMLSTTALFSIRKITDDPLWQPSLREGMPSAISGYPYLENPDMAALGSGNKSVLFGDMSKFKIRIVNRVNFARYNETYAGNGQIGFEAYIRTDSDLVNAGSNPVIYADSA